MSNNIEIAVWDHAYSFVMDIAFMINDNEIQYNETGKIIYPFENDKLINSPQLQQTYFKRQEKIDKLEDNEEKKLIITNEVMKQEAIKCLYEIKKKGLETAEAYKYFKTYMLDYALDPDYAQNMIDMIANNFTEASKKVGNYLNNKYFIEKSSTEITIQNPDLRELYDLRQTKINSRNSIAITNNLLLFQFVKAIKNSKDGDEFKEKIKQLLNPDYAQFFITYISDNYTTIAVFRVDELGRKLLGAKNDDNFHIREIVKENGSIEIQINENSCLNEIYKLRQQKIENNKLAKQYISNETFLYLIVQVLHEKDVTQQNFEEKIKMALDPDYAQQFINYIYDGYEYIVEFNEYNKAINPIKDNGEELEITDSILQNLYDLRKNKLDSLNHNKYLPNYKFLQYVYETLNAAKNSKENFYSLLMARLKNFSDEKEQENAEVIENYIKLYPPQLAGTIPAFYGTQLKIPYKMNPTVSYSEINGFAVKLKSVQNNNIVYSGEVTNELHYDKDNNFIYLNIMDANNIFRSGSYYKVQIAYLNKRNEVGYYSTVGIVKYTKKPNVYIDGLKPYELHSGLYSYIGVYSQYEKDVTEKVYSYNFTMYDENGAIFETSGEILHNHENDDEIYETKDQYFITKSLKENKIYTLVYTVTTINGLIISSPEYRIIQQSTVPPETDIKILAFMNTENGYANIQLLGENNDNGTEAVITGNFLITRSSSENNYETWSEISRLVFYGEKPSAYNYKDFTVQHGFGYKYAIQQYNQTYQIYSNRVISNEIVAEFEHAFLYDGERQLKIKYNPKVSSFKTTLLEQKTNTLGGKFPLFFRNGNVNYKEFPISGLISYLSDEEQIFMTDKQLQLEDTSILKREYTLKENVKSSNNEYFNNIYDAQLAYDLQKVYTIKETQNSNDATISKQRTRTTDLVDYNVVAERVFKLNVLDFLNDGKPKLFRSPGEGNYIVRLMNSSLSPEDKTGRMLHTFSTTATEIDDYSYEKLKKYSLLPNVKEPEIQQLRWKTVMVRDLINQLDPNDDKDFISIGKENNIQSIQCMDMTPGDKIIILPTDPKATPIEIVIGVTGAYSINFDISPQKIEISKNSRQGQITFSYYSNVLNQFDTYKAIKISDIPLMQLRPTKKYIDWNKYVYIGTENKDIKEFYKLEDIKQKITKYYFLNFSKIDPHWEQTYDSNNVTENYEYKFWIDGREIDITNDLNYTLTQLDHIPHIVLGNGIILDISIQRREIEFDIETTNKEVVYRKEIYMDAYNRVIEAITNPAFIYDYEFCLQEYKQDMYQSYDNFLQSIIQALKEKEVAI